ncbi:hypothetical protein LTR84_000851 [Exophiala bonariae]|uniref:TauD/TfdA-like domain-containing protein n=1 Tax=Exophiala bonariae TaxID=1690606 RepID=A0AAV9NRR5_9EURO|nr:hypothetical protein LTR84_000851 [Exophiala bonariae]
MAPTTVESPRAPTVGHTTASHEPDTTSNSNPAFYATNRYKLDSLPLELAPAKDLTLDRKISAASRLAANGTIRDLLTNHGAVHFKGLGLKSAEEFSRFAQSFGWRPHEDIGNPVRRTVLAYNVATANEGPNTQPVYPHNEFGLSPHYPAYVFFYCLSAPETGGETPVNNSITLYDKLKQQVPDFIKVVEEKGVRYQLFYRNRPRSDISSPGTSLLQSYGINVLDSDDTETARSKIEDEIRRLPTATWQWENQSPDNKLGDLRVFQRLPAVRRHEQTGKQAFFNNVISRYLNAKTAGTLDPPYLNKDGDYQPPALYADDTPIPHEYLEAAVQIVNDTRSLVLWNTGDVLLIDNHAVQHGREPWTGDRKLLASLWDEPSVGVQKS